MGWRWLRYQKREGKELDSFVSAFVPQMFLVRDEAIQAEPCPQVNKEYVNHKFKKKKVL